MSGKLSKLVTPGDQIGEINIPRRVLSTFTEVIKDVLANMTDCLTRNQTSQDGIAVTFGQCIDCEIKFGHDLSIMEGGILCP